MKIQIFLRESVPDRTGELLLRLLPSLDGVTSVNRLAEGVELIVNSTDDEDRALNYRSRTTSKCDDLHLVADILLDVHNLIHKELIGTSVTCLELSTKSETAGVKNLEELAPRLGHVGRGAANHHDDRLVLTFSGPPSNLLQFAVDWAIATKEKSSIRVGFDLASGNAFTIASLGAGGHLLGSAAFVREIRDDCRYREDVHPLGRFRLSAADPDVLYSVYGESFGNPDPIALGGRPVTTEPIRVPPKITDHDAACFSISYAPDVVYAKAMFQFDAGAFCLMSGDRFSADNSFVYEAGVSNSAVQRFELWPKKAETSRQTLQITFQDRDGRPMAEPAQYLIQLTKTSPFKPSSLIDFGLWVWERTGDWFLSQRWYLQVSMLLALIPVAWTYDYFRQGGPSEFVHAAAKKVLNIHLPLRNLFPYTSSWSDDSKKTEDLKKYWTNSTAWVIMQPNDQFHSPVTVRGPQIGLTVLEDQDFSFYDFKVDFKMIVTKDQRSAAWILRAANSSHYYLFILKWPDGKKPAEIDAFSVSAGERRIMVPDPSSQPTWYKELKEKDTVRVQITVNCYQFQHTVTRVSNPLADKPPEDPALSNVPLPISFTDTLPLQGTHYGLVGFGTDQQVGNMDLQYVQILDPKAGDSNCRAR